MIMMFSKNTVSIYENTYKKKHKFAIILSLLFQLGGCEHYSVSTNDDNQNGEIYWEQTSGPYGGHITDIVKSPTNLMYAGTLYRGGVFLSSDDGDSWKQLNVPVLNPGSVDVYSLIMNSRGYIFAGISGGIIRSTDAGNSWDKVYNGGWTQALYVNSNDEIFTGIQFGSERIYYKVLKSENNGDSWTELIINLNVANVNCISMAPDGAIYIGTHGRLIRSLDNGITWFNVNLGIPEPNVWAIAFDSIGNILCSVFGKGVYRSNDNGSTWIAFNNGLSNLYVRKIFINEDDKIYLVANEGLLFIKNSGDDWVQINSKLCINSTRSTVLIEDKNKDIIVGSGQFGVFKSIDSGGNWFQTKFPGSDIRCMAINPNDHIFTGSFLEGVSVSQDQGETWRYLGLSDVDVQAITINSQNHIFVATEAFVTSSGLGGVFRSVDNGRSWENINNGLNTIYTNSIVCNSSDYLFVGTSDGVFISRTNGNNWEQTSLKSGIESMTINHSDHLFAAQRGKVFKTMDDGVLWIEMSEGLVANSVIVDLAVNSKDELFGVTGRSVYCFSDILNRWIEKANDPNFTFRGIAIDSRDRIFTGKGTGVYFSSDNGSNWEFVKDGLNNNLVKNLVINSDFIYAGTSGGGVYRSNID